MTGSRSSVDRRRDETVYRVSPGTKAPPQVVGWSPDGRWVVFFSRFHGKTGVPLNTAPADGGDWVNVFDPVLPYDDFLSWCGQHLALSGGGDKSPSEGNQILVSGPAGLAVSQPVERLQPKLILAGVLAERTVDHRDSDTERRGVAARAREPRAVAARHRRHAAGAADGARQGRVRGRLGGRPTVGTSWSIRPGLDPSSPGVLLLFRVDPSSGKTTRAPGPVARLGSARGEDGHTDWSSTTDWYRPE